MQHILLLLNSKISLPPHGACIHSPSPQKRANEVEIFLQIYVHSLLYESTYAPRLFLWVVADNASEYHEFRAPPFKEGYLVLLAHVNEGLDLFGHPDDSRDGQACQVDHTH